MKKMLLALSLIGLLAGCASHENNATGGTSDQYNTSSSDQNNNNAMHGTNPETGTNNNQGQSMAPK